MLNKLVFSSNSCLVYTQLPLGHFVEKFVLVVKGLAAVLWEKEKSFVPLCLIVLGKS